jgi:hypothetical protein
MLAWGGGALMPASNAQVAIKRWLDDAKDAKKSGGVVWCIFGAFLVSRHLFFYPLGVVPIITAVKLV